MRWIAGQTLRLFQKVKSFSWLLMILFLNSIGQIEAVEAAPASPTGAEAHFPKPANTHHGSGIYVAAVEGPEPIGRSPLLRTPKAQISFDLFGLF
jgi:hypothetical protein